ncbi:MAG: homocysteine biosynthesis protein [Candidatus Aminicenantales bacterium]
MPKTIEQINEKIARKTAKVVRADRMTEIVREIGPDRAAEEVDVVTTGTFGAMCSSGVWLNFGHSEPPIKMSRVWLNDVEAYAGVAAVDAYLGATQLSETEGLRYGGAHVIEDLLRGKTVTLRAIAYGTDCYPRKEILTTLSLDDLNTALLFNPRNGYQRYNAATNASQRKIRTYMGTLLPNLGNVTYSGAGSLSPLSNDPDYRTIGLGTKIFLGGAEGFVTGPGTQHNPEQGFGTLMVQGDLKRMSTVFLRAASFPGYGCTMYVGLGIPIPILDADLARRTAVSDEEISTKIYDYSVPSRTRPALKITNYAELKSGRVEIGGKSVPTASLSSLTLARRVADELKRRIETGLFSLTAPVQTLPTKAVVRPLEVRPAKKDAAE